jgi:hypothetical protein
MNAYVVYGFLAVVIVLLVMVIGRLSRQKQASSLDQALPTILDSLKNLSAVESQVNALAQGNSLVVQNINKLEVSFKGLETKFAQGTGDVKQAISKDVGDARRVLVELKTKF